MTEAPENYIAPRVAAIKRKQAIRVWTVGLAVVLIWVLLILLAPLTKANGFVFISSPLYQFFSYLCHQMSERSFFVDGGQFGVCSRCFGVYFGLFLGFAVYPLWRSVEAIEPLPRFWLFLSLIPVGVDWSLTAFGIWENTQPSRFITGLILGAACSAYIVPGLVEITQNLTFRQTRRRH